MDWIKVEDRLPYEGSHLVMGYATREIVDYGIFMRGKFYRLTDTYESDPQKPTHWFIPLPPPSLTPKN